jgi:hypothetical protein
MRIGSRTVFPGRYSDNGGLLCLLEVSIIDRFNPSSYVTYRQACNMQKLRTSGFTCFVWISEQTAIISVYSINWLVCITETGCVYCAVRNKYLRKFRLILVFKGLSIFSARKKNLFISKRVQSVQLCPLQQSPPACRHALKLSRTRIDTVDFHPTTFIPGGLQKKKGTSFYFSPSQRLRLSHMEEVEWSTRASASLLPTSLLWNVTELSTSTKACSL